MKKMKKKRAITPKHTITNDYRMVSSKNTDDTTINEVTHNSRVTAISRVIRNIKRKKKMLKSQRIRRNFRHFSELKSR